MATTFFFGETFLVVGFTVFGFSAFLGIAAFIFFGVIFFGFAGDFAFFSLTAAAFFGFAEMAGHPVTTCSNPTTSKSDSRCRI